MQKLERIALDVVEQVRKENPGVNPASDNYQMILALEGINWGMAIFEDLMQQQAKDSIFEEMGDEDS